MKKPLIVILSIVMLFASSCTMKKLLWQYMQADNIISAKALASTQDNELYDLNNAELCIATTGDIIDEAVFLPGSATVDASFILFFILFLLPWMLFPGLYCKEENNPSFNTLLPLTLPLYLKLGRLVYYS